MGAAGVSPAPVPCQVMFVQRVLEGVLVFFFSPPSFIFPLLYVTAQIFGLSQLRGGVSVWLLGGAGALLCTLRVLQNAGRVGRGVGVLRPPTLAALVSTSWGWPERCQLRQWGPPASLLGGSQGRIQPPPPGTLRWWKAGSELDGGSCGGSLSRFPLIFSQTTLHAPWPPLLGPAPGRALGSWGPPAPSKGWHQPQTSRKLWLKRGSTDPALGLHLLPCVFTSGADPPTSLECLIPRSSFFC